MKDLEFIYRGFKIVEDEYYYTLYEIGKKKPKLYMLYSGIFVNEPPYEDSFRKEDDYFKGKNIVDHIFRSIDKFIKERGQ